MNERINKHIADVHVMYVNFHNYHWNVKGLQFKSIHEMTEAYYEKLAVLFDDLAEGLLMKGEKPPVTVSQYMKLAEVKEETETEFTTAEVLSKVKESFEYLVKEFEITRKEAAAADDAVTEAFFAETIGFLRKEIWFISSSVK